MRTFRKAALILSVNILVVVIMVLAFAQPSVVKVLLKEAKSGDYDTLFLGQSHGETSMNPYVFSNEMGVDALNLNRRLMPLEDIYYLLLEANKNECFKMVVLDIDPSYWSGSFSAECGKDTNLFPYLTGYRRLSYVAELLWKQKWNNVLFDYEIGKTTVLRSPKVVQSKLNWAYVSGSEDSIRTTFECLGISKTYRYEGRGFRYGFEKSGISWPTWTFVVDSILDEKIAVFEQIVEYCREKNIELVCVQSALPPYRLRNENMDVVHDYFTQLCDDNGVCFIDMNYARGLHQVDDEYVDLDGHMMGQLAERHTKLLCDALKAEDRDVFFYETFGEVLEGLEK